jgi:hypothetical protein
MIDLMIGIAIGVIFSDKAKTVFRKLKSLLSELGHCDHEEKKS